MTKRLLAKVGTYTNAQNETKNEYVKLGILKQGDQGGEYMILDPTVNLAGVLMKQNALAAKEGKQIRDAVMVSVFENDNNQPQQIPSMAQQQGQQSGFQQNQGFQNQGGFQQQPGKHQQYSVEDFDDGIPF